jgi:CRP-like cAMP-binding protein
MACDPQLLADVELFEHVDDEDRARLAEFIDACQLAAGSTLFKTGEPGDSLYIVRSGEVELFIKDTAGQKILLTIASPGEVFGELALLDRGPRTATALALTDCELLELDRDDLMRLFQKSPSCSASPTGFHGSAAACCFSCSTCCGSASGSRSMSGRLVSRSSIHSRLAC